jgi:hypothetical protein
VALWDSADLARRCVLHARRPAIDQAMPAANWYDFLTEAQPEAHSDLVTRFPDLAYGAPLLLVSADGGKTYPFGVDAAGDAIRPMGHAEIYPSLASIPDAPLSPGEDFIFEGALLRIPNNKTRLFPAGPYARLVIRPDTAISAASQPVLQPKAARLLLVWKALEYWAARPGSGQAPEYYERKYLQYRDKMWLELATAYNAMGAQAPGVGLRVWWSRLDMGASGLNV